MNIYSRSLILAAMTAVSLTQGCSCSSDDDPVPPVVVEPPATQTFAISGTVAKGIVSGGVVNVCPIVNRAADCTTPVVTGTTSAVGSYSVAIPTDFTSRSFVVRVTPGATTRMICDLPQGCSSVVFGGSYTPNSNFVLDSYLPSAAPNAVANVTTLTSVATSLAFANMQSNPSESVADAFRRAGAQVVDRFGLQGDITQLPVVDLTQLASLQGASLDVLAYNSYNSAIVSSVVGPDTTIEDALAQFRQTFASGGIADNPATPNTLGLNDILAQAKATLDAVVAHHPGVTVPGLAQAITRIEAAATAVNNQEPSDTPKQGTASTTANALPLAKVKAFVETLGDLGNTIDLVAIKDKQGNSTTIGARADAFDMQLQAADMATSEGVEQVTEATAMVVEAMANAYEAYDENNALTSWVSPDGIVVAIMPKIKDGTDDIVESVSLKVAGPKNDAGTYTSVPVTVIIDGKTSTVAVNMTGTEMHSHTNGQPDSNGVETDTVMGDFMVKGTAESDTVKMEVYDTSKVSLGESMSVTSVVDGVESTVATASSPKLMLKVMLAQKVPTEQGGDPVSFTGMLDLNLSMLKATETTDMASEAAQETTVVTAGTLALKVWGEVKNTSGDLAKLSVVVNGDATGLSITEMVAGGVTTQTDNETANKYAALNAVVNFNADLAGNFGLVSVGLSASRTGLDAASGNVSVTWPGNKITIDADDDNNDATAQVITASNQDGVKAVFTENSDSKWTGKFSLNGVDYGTLSGPTVTFTDNEFLSFDIFE